MAIQSQPSRIPQPFAGSGTKNVIPATNATPSASQAASWASGFPPECSQPISAGGCPVPRNDVNGVLSQLSQDYSFRQDGGVWDWSALADYDTQRMVRGSDGLLYWSVAQSGPGVAAGAQDPTADDGTYWNSPFVKTASPLESSGAAASTEWVRQVLGAAYYVDAANGDDANGGRTQAAPLKTIGRALANADADGVSHFTLSVAAGTYAESLTVYDKSIMLSLQGNATISGNVELYRTHVLVEDGEAGYALTISASSGDSALYIGEASFFKTWCSMTVSASGTEYVVRVGGGSGLYSNPGTTFTVSASGVSNFAMRVSNTSYAIMNGDVAIGGTSSGGGLLVAFSSSAFFAGAFSQADIFTAGFGVLCRGGSSVTFSYSSSISIRGSSQTYTSALSSSQTSAISFLNCSGVDVYTKSIGSNAVHAEASSSIFFISTTCTIHLTGAQRGLFATGGGTVFVSAGTMAFSGTVSSATAMATVSGSIRFGEGAAASGTVTGTRYIAQTGGQINTNGGGANFFPGSSAGSATTTSYGYYG